MPRRVESVNRPAPLPAPQWQNLFLEPAYLDDIAHEADGEEGDWQQELPAVSLQRRRRGGRRITSAAA